MVSLNTKVSQKRSREYFAIQNEISLANILHKVTRIWIFERQYKFSDSTKI